MFPQVIVFPFLVYVTAGNTAGTDIFELCVQWSVIVPEFQGNP
jgi:hypothetical protein